MNTVLLLATVAAALLVGAEGMNKLDRTNLRQPGLSWQERGLLMLRALGWSLLVLSCGCILTTPLVPSWPPITIRESGVVGGFALLVLRERLREWCTHRAVADPFDRTVRITPETAALLKSAMPADLAMTRARERAERSEG